MWRTTGGDISVDSVGPRGTKAVTIIVLFPLHVFVYAVETDLNPEIDIISFAAAAADL